MRMGEFSRRTGVSQRLLRYYEEQGLLAPARRPSGYREYTEEDVVTVRGIRVLLAAGLNTATIAELLPCMIDDDGALAPGCSGMLPDLTKERDRIDEAVAGLLAARARLDGIINATVPGAPADPDACYAGVAPGPV
ncbi:MerR family transcriptional regulator [Streptomyces sp. AN091965]|uniref:MerR family transcriptional regulator n=1 Tax=Streptomyces sp. AN091965 TaxID=2927803 RepID=UPI001F604A83|nr:MerR family transcriptional regulator [Streptomyces sp. AN091965]MCI3934877.1 MerR family transcriptional regulator [Streptomyces sp. AN091965]